jgi:hypothetical protein
VTTPQVPGDKDEHAPSNMAQTIGIAVGCAGAYIILVVGLMIYCKGRRARQAKNKLSKFIYISLYSPMSRNGKNIVVYNFVQA